MSFLNRIRAALTGLRKAPEHTSTALFQPRADGLGGALPLLFTREDRLPPEAEERPFRFRD
ncbi:hypothetical protein [Deinococcus gobiensis]|uniref:Uncharacterized protein n=1 Tax=Deinococcus gobiensis (strain DSM 21396 / JCM 16679 / CGMCC 1.7299 / I-0) TaxID=745776 RepID=H8GT29_DEIGI|nr:hypothetical protein [Deinococcus gobiensis]AFD25313.1 hypothetical protein DGo_CA1386 [Deinococcus gobiensis I-0]